MSITFVLSDVFVSNSILQRDNLATASSVAIHITPTDTMLPLNMQAVYLGALFKDQHGKHVLPLPYPYITT